MFVACLIQALDDVLVSWGNIAHDEGLQLVRWSMWRYMLIMTLDEGEHGLCTLEQGVIAGVTSTLMWDLNYVFVCGDAAMQDIRVACLLNMGT